MFKECPKSPNGRHHWVSNQEFHKDKVIWCDVCGKVK